MISGRPSSLASANQRPNAVACSLPSAESGTSTSRWSRAIRSRPCAVATSRATLPALWPWRTNHKTAGQRWVIRLMPWVVCSSEW